MFSRVIERRVARSSVVHAARPKHTRALVVVTLILAIGPNGVDTARVSLQATRVLITALPSYSSEPGFVNLLIGHTPRDGDRDVVVEVESVDLFREASGNLLFETAE